MQQAFSVSRRRCRCRGGVFDMNDGGFFGLAEAFSIQKTEAFLLQMTEAFSVSRRRFR